MVNFDYFKINYNKLENLKKVNYFYFILIVILMISFIIILSFFVYVKCKFTFYGIYKDSYLNIKINTKLSDKINNNNYLEYENTKIKYEIISYDDYELIDNDIYQNIRLKIDKELIDNEIGLYTIYYQKKKLIFFILEMFK